MPDLICGGIDVGVATLAELRSCATDVTRLAAFSLACIVIGLAAMTYLLVSKKGD